MMNDNDFSFKLSPRILIVEDNIALNQMLGNALSSICENIIRVETGKEAREVVSEYSVDVILLDENLPDEQGIDWLLWFKSEGHSGEVISMTAKPDIQNVLKSINSGAYDYLVKPFDSIHSVINRVNRAIAHRASKLEREAFIAHLSALNSQILEQNRLLEAKVAERTKALEKLTLTDDVTQLYNQRFLFNALNREYNRAQRYGRPLSVLMLDVDHFKEINDHTDHLFGSRVLSWVANVIKESIRSTDFPVRYGGDEFTILMPETTREQALVVAERIRSTFVEERYVEPTHQASITVSVGLAEAHRDGNAETLLQAADHALYDAKNAGRNRIEVRIPLPADANLAATRRKQPRANIEAQVLLRRPGQGDLRGNMFQLGAGGMGLTVAGKLDAGEPVHLSLELEHQLIQIEGRVVWTDNKTEESRVGICFNELARDQEHWLHNYVQLRRMLRGDHDRANFVQ